MGSPIVLPVFFLDGKGGAKKQVKNVAWFLHCATTLASLWHEKAEAAFCSTTAKPYNKESCTSFDVFFAF